MTLLLQIGQWVEMVRAGLTTTKAIVTAINDGKAGAVDGTVELTAADVEARIDAALSADLQTGDATADRIEGRKV